MKRLLVAPSALITACLVFTTDAAPIAGVDFEDGSGGYSRTPDDLNLGDGITVSSDWAIDANGNIRNDGGANGAGAYEGNFPARLQDPSATWSITIPDTVVLDLDNIFFATRGATGSTGGIGGRDIGFLTSLDTSDLYFNGSLPNRNNSSSDDWLEVSIDLTDAKYKGLTDTTVDFIWYSPNAADIDGIVVSGTIVPEPSSLALLGLGGLLIARRRR